MRIVGEIEHEEYKITIFKMNTRFSLKVENTKFEQTYKLRQIEKVQEVRQLVDRAFLENVTAVFAAMQENITSAMTKKMKPEEEEFDEII